MKDKTLKIRVSSKDLAEIKRRAELATCNVSAYVTTVSLGYTLVVVDGTREFLHELRKIGGNTMFNIFSKYKKGFINLFGGYKDIVTVKELCEMLNIGKNTAYELLQSGAIKSIKIGKVYKIPKKYVAEYIKNNCN